MTLSSTLLKKLPRRMTIELVYSQVHWCNFTIPEEYISTAIGSASIVLGRTYTCNVLGGEETKFGEYVQTHEKVDNIMRERTLSAIYLRSIGTSKEAFIILVYKRGDIFIVEKQRQSLFQKR